jgi:hypothetical protein
VTHYTRNVSVVFAALVPLVVTTPARTQVQPPSSGASAVGAYVETVPTTGPSAVDAYVETVPTAGSPTPGTRKETLSSLTPTAKAALEKLPRATASALEKVSSSSVYGAPLSRQPRLVTAESSSNVSVSDTLRGTAQALGTAGDTRLLGLLIVLVVTTFGAIALAAIHARRSSRGPGR